MGEIVYKTLNQKFERLVSGVRRDFAKSWKLCSKTHRHVQREQVKTTHKCQSRHKKCTHKSGQKTRFRVFSKRERVQITKISKEQREKLLQNPYVAGLSEKQIYYTEEFKQKALAEYALGKTARQIFSNAGFELEKYLNKMTMLLKHRNHAVELKCR